MPPFSALNAAARTRAAATRRPVRVRAAALAATLAALFAAGPLPSAALDVAGLSKDISACTNFYSYANQQWLDRTEIPADRSGWGSGAELVRRNEETLKAALEQVALDPAAIRNPSIRKTAEYFNSGMDTATIDRLGLEPLQSDFALIAALTKPADLPRVFARLNRIGIATPLTFEVRPDDKNAQRNMVHVAQGGLGLPDRDYYFPKDKKGEDILAAYQRHVAKMLALAGASPADSERDAAIVVALEKRFAENSRTRVERRDPELNYNPRSLAALTKEAPGFAWDAYFTATGTPNPGALSVSQPQYATTVAAAASDTPIAVWQVYLRWHLLRETSSKLAAPFAREHFDFYEALLGGKKSQPPRSREVIDTVGGARFGEHPLGQNGLAQLFVERSFPPQAKARALELVDNVKAALRDRIQALDWMGPETKKQALHKLAKMRVKVGYPDKWQDLSALHIDPKGYLANWMASNAFSFDYDTAKLNKPVDRQEWQIAAHIVNAYYEPLLNEIVFPAGILQPPYFDAKADDAVNYGGIGMVIGHEITHGFDDTGRQYNADGNLKDWWTKEDARRYLERSAGVVKQFDAFEGIDGLHVNGKLTLGENTADLGGVKIAYLALQKALKKHPVGPIDGFTPDQRFFLSLADIWRAKQRPELERLMITTNEHSPPRFRVLGPVANLPEFSAAFSCKAGDAGVRAAADRVLIW